MCQCLDFRLYNSNDEMVKTNKHFSVSFESSFLVFYNLYNVNASEPVVIWLWGTLKCCWTYKCPMTLKTWTGDIHTMNSVLVAAAQSLQSRPTPCDTMDCSPSGSPVPGILQARTLEWPAISFSNAGKWKVKVKSLSRVRLLATHGLQPTRLLHPVEFLGESTEVGCHCLLRKCAYVFPNKI